jgi:hypothetical protein
MIIIQLAGGLGNQLQQYALYQKFKSLGAEVKLDLSWFEQFEDTDQEPDNKEQIKEHNRMNKINPAMKKDILATKRRCELNFFDHLPYECCTEKEKTALTGSRGLAGKLRRKLLPQTVHWYKEKQMYDPELLSYRQMYLSGYFACEKYYADILPELRKLIRFPEIADAQKRMANEEILERIRSSRAVSVHIRRGDYLQPENAAMFGNICTEEYYESALDYMKEKIEDPHFFIFSDDVAYVREHYQGEEYTIVDINHGDDSFYDMYLMSRCEGNICANSTFSFWGARLNARTDKIMIRPTIQKNSQMFEEQVMKDLWKEWICVDPWGKRYFMHAGKGKSK